MTDIELKVDGLKELNRKLEQFTVKTQKSMITSALRAAAKPIQAAAKQNAQRTRHPSSGALSQSIGIKAKRLRGSAAVSSLWVAPIRTDKSAVSQYAGFYGGASVSSVNAGIRHGHLVELGTKHSAARPWLRPALDQNKDRAVSIFKTTLAKRIDREVRKINRGKR